MFTVNSFHLIEIIYNFHFILGYTFELVAF